MKDRGSGERFHLRGVVLPDDVVRDVWIAGGVFTFEPVEGAETLATDVVLIPGLVDAHAHLGLASPAPATASPGERSRASARRQLEAGVLAIREPGNPDLGSIGIGPHEGLPRVQTGGHLLAAIGRYFPGLGREIEPATLPDVAEEEFAASGAWVKVIGDFIVAGQGLRPSFPLDALAETATRIHALGGRLAMHCGGDEAVDLAIAAGFDSVEHGTTMRSDQIPALRERGIAFTPTIAITSSLVGLAEQLGASSAGVRRIADGVRDLPAIVRAAGDAGVTILAGTDTGVPHGAVREEIALLRQAGLSADAALGAGSWTARTYLGLPSIDEGAPADLVALREDPRADAAALAEPAVIVLDGRLVRGPP